MATLDELIGSWSVSLRGANRAPRTVAQYADESLAQFRRWMAEHEPDLAPAAISRQHAHPEAPPPARPPRQPDRHGRLGLDIERQGLDGIRHDRIGITRKSEASGGRPEAWAEALDLGIDL